MLIDDVQWRDDACRQLLQELLLRAAHWPLYVSPVCREPVPSWVAELERTDRVALPRLPRAVIAGLVEAWVAPVSLPGDTVAPICDRAHGRPHFVRELVHVLRAAPAERRTTSMSRCRGSRQRAGPGSGGGSMRTAQAEIGMGLWARQRQDGAGALVLYLQAAEGDGEEPWVVTSAVSNADTQLLMLYGSARVLPRSQQKRDSVRAAGAEATLQETVRVGHAFPASERPR